MHIRNGDASHALGPVNGQPDGAFSFFDINNRASAHAARTVMAKTQNLQGALRALARIARLELDDFRNQAANLRAAHIQRGQNGGFWMSRTNRTRRTGRKLHNGHPTRILNLTETSGPLTGGSFSHWLQRRVQHLAASAARKPSGLANEDQ